MVSYKRLTMVVILTQMNQDFMYKHAFQNQTK